MSIEAMKQALSVLETGEYIGGVTVRLRQAIAEAEKQEPYCWVQSKFNQGLFYKEKPRRIHTIPLYTAPPDVKHWKDLAEYRLQLLMKMPENKSWQGLTDEGIDDAWRSLAILSDKGLQELRREYARAIEAKLKEKNT